MDEIETNYRIRGLKWLFSRMGSSNASIIPKYVWKRIMKKACIYKNEQIITEYICG